MNLVYSRRRCSNNLCDGFFTPKRKDNISCSRKCASVVSSRRRRSKGLCNYCTRPRIEDNKWRCAYHIRVAKINDKDTKERRRESLSRLNLCNLCGGPLLKDEVSFCDTCREEKNRKGREHHKEYGRRDR